MAGQLNLTSTLTSPNSEFNLEAQNKSFPTASFNSQEADLLQRQFNQVIAPFPSGVTNTLIQDRADTIALTATFAKQIFDKKLFGGLNAADNEIGFDVLRPGHIRSSPSSGASQNNWYFTPSSAGWNDWIGNGSGNNYTITKDQVVVVLGVIDQDVSTELSGVNVQSFGRNVDMIPKDLNGIRIKDNANEIQAAPLPSLIGQENDQVHARLDYSRATESEPRLFGFTFGLGSYMNTESY